jgi:hypothetical protein
MRWADQLAERISPCSEQRARQPNGFTWTTIRRAHLAQ